MNRPTLFFVIAVVATGCGFRAQNVTASASHNASSANLPPGHPAIGSDSTPDDSDSDSLVISGNIRQTMNAGGYTYLRVGTTDGDVWAAVPEAQLQVGAPVTVKGQLVMEHFQSKTLKRSFDKIIFGTLAGTDLPDDAEAPNTVTA